MNYFMENPRGNVELFPAAARNWNCPTLVGINYFVLVFFIGDEIEFRGVRYGKFVNLIPSLDLTNGGDGLVCNKMTSAAVVAQRGKQSNSGKDVCFSATVRT